MQPSRCTPRQTERPGPTRRIPQPTTGSYTTAWDTIGDMFGLTPVRWARAEDGSVMAEILLQAGAYP